MSDFKSNQNSFFTISRTAEIIGVQSHVLRFWEKKFSSINPKKSLSGRRFYSSNDIEFGMTEQEFLNGIEDKKKEE